MRERKIRISEKTFDKLVKLMMLTTSPNDHEALCAIRKVNQFLLDANVTWEAVLRDVVFETVKIIESSIPRCQSIQEKLEYCLDYGGSRDMDFLESLQDTFHKWGSLTYKQERALEKIYSRLI